MKELMKDSILISLISNFLSGITASAVMLRTMTSLDDVLFNMAEIAGLGISAIAFKIVDTKSKRDWFIRHKWFTVLYKPFTYVVIAVVSFYWMEWRYLLICVVWDAVSSTNRTILKSRENLLLDNDELTDYQIELERWGRIGALAGFVVAMGYVHLLGNPLELGVALLLQVSGTCLLASRDYRWIVMEKCDKS